MQRPLSWSSTKTLLTLSAALILLAPAASSASITFNSTSDWSTGNFTDTRTAEGDLFLGYRSGEASDVDASQYSSVSGDTAWDEYIVGVQVNGIDSSSGDNEGYRDFTNRTSQAFKPGESYTIRVQLNTDGAEDYVTVAFDWDDDQSLEDEKVYKIGHCSGSPCQVSDKVTVPSSTALNSSVAMRVMSQFDSYLTSPTSDPNFGEVEDYSVYIPGYKALGSYTTGWIDTGRLASWDFLNYSVSGLNSASAEVKMIVRDTAYQGGLSDISFPSNGFNTLNISNLKDAREFKLDLSLSSSDVEKTPVFDFMEMNHKLINITETDVKNYSAQHKFNVSAVAEHPNGSSGLESCKLFYSYGSGFKELSASLSSMNNGKACNATISDSLQNIGFDASPSVDYYFRFLDSESVSRVTEVRTHRLPNRRPEINSTTTSVSQDSHSFNVTSVGYDVDEGSSEIQSCTINVNDGDGNSFAGGKLDNSAGNTDQASCKAEINSSIEGFTPGEELNVEASFTDVAGATASQTITETLPNHPPEIASVNTVPETSGHQFNVTAEINAGDSEEDLLNGECRLFLSHGSTQITVEDSETEIYGNVEDDGKAFCNYTVSASDSENFSVGDDINAKVEFTDEWGASVNSSIVTETLPNNEPNAPSGLDLQVQDPDSVFEGVFNVSFDIPSDPDGDDVTVKAYVGGSSDPSFVENSRLFTSTGTGKILIGNDTEFTDGEDYFIDLEACDTYGSCSDRASTSFTANEEPSIQEAGPSTDPVNLEDGDTTDISANITDSQTQIEWAYFEIRNASNGNIIDTENTTRSEHSGDYWNSTDFTVDANTSYDWEITASDGFETSKASGSFAMGATPPVIDSLGLENIPGEHSFTVNANISDADGADTIEEAEINITDGEGNFDAYNVSILNGSSGTEASIEETVVDSSVPGFRIGEIVQVELSVTGVNGSTTTQSSSKEIPNRPPEVSNIQITPSSPESDEVLNVTYSITDPEGDEVSQEDVEYRWIRNGNPTIITSRTVETTATAEGQNWNVSVQAQDEYGATSGRRYPDSRATVVNSPPEISEAVSVENLSDHRMKASAVGLDVNGQSDFTGCTVEISQGQESVTVSSTPDSSYGSVNEMRCEAVIGPSNASWLRPGEDVNVSVKFTDDDGASAESYTVRKVPNERPSVDLIFPEDKNFSSSDLDLEWSMSDPENDDLTAEVKIFDSAGLYVKENVSSSSKGLSSLPDSSYSWNVTVYDNYNGEAISSTESSTGEFIVDTTAPVNEESSVNALDGTPDTLEQNDSIEISTKWSDGFELRNAKIYENVTDSNHSINVSEFESGWANLTLSKSQVNAGEASYTVYAYDHVGNLKKFTETFTVEDIEKPEIQEISFTPELGNQAAYDPNKSVSVEASLEDNLEISKALIRYRENSSKAWKKAELTEEPSGNFTGSFTPEKGGSYSFEVFVNDTFGNVRTQAFSQDIEVDLTWTAGDDLEATSTFSENLADFEPFTVENTGDKALEFNLSNSTDANLSLNYDAPESFELAPGDSREVDLNASTSLQTGEAVNLDFSLVLNASNGSELADPSSRKVSGVAHFVEGPLIQISESRFSEEVTQGTTQGYEFNFTNIGVETMNQSNLDFDLPSGWTNTLEGGELDEIAPDESVTRRAVFEVSESAETGSQTIGVSVSSGNYSFSDSFTVTVKEASEEEPPEPEPPSGGGGGFPSVPGGGGEDRIPEGTSDKLLQSSSSFELVRGQDQNFTVNFTNPTAYNLSNISVEVSGFRSQYVELGTSYIDSLNVNRSRPFLVSITAPEFFSSQSFELNFTITGTGFDPEAFTDQYFNFTLNKIVSLEIKEISEARASNLTERMEDLMQRMESQGLSTSDVEDIVSEARDELEQGQYGQVRTSFQEVQSTFTTAKEARNEIRTLENKIDAAQAQGLTVNQARRMLNLAEAAMDRGAYETASSRLDEARNLYQLQTKGQVNYIYLITSNWMTILAAIVVLWILSLLAYYRFRLYRINSKLEGLEEKERSIEKMKKQDQKKAFEQQEMSIDEYEDAEDEYNEELVEIIEKRAELESMKANLSNLKEEEALKQERDRLKEIIEETQRAYVEGDIADTGMYETKVEELTEKLSDVESELAEKEAKTKNKQGLKPVQEAKKWIEKLKQRF